MLEGGTIVSKLHNYQLYDSILSKACILLGITKEDMVRINFMKNSKEAFALLEKLYNENREKIIIL